MNSARSKLTLMFMPCGSVGFTSSISLRTPRDSSTVFALDCWEMPSETAAWPLARARARSLSAASSTRATSPSRTSWPSLPRPMTSSRKSFSLSSPVRVRRVYSRCVDSSRPAGSSTFSARSTDSISFTVRPRAASAWRSIHTRIAYWRSPPMRTRATPGTVEKRSIRMRSA